MLLSFVINKIQAQIHQYHTIFNDPNKQVPTKLNNLTKQINNEVGKLASNLKYIHVAISLNISTFYEQGKILEIYLKNLANTTTSKICRIPFTKAARNI
jgi:hypothetical protein